MTSIVAAIVKVILAGAWHSDFTSSYQSSSPFQCMMSFRLAHWNPRVCQSETDLAVVAAECGELPPTQ